MTSSTWILALLPALVAPHGPQEGQERPPLGPWVRKDRVPLVPLPDGFIDFKRVPDGGRTPTIEQLGERVVLLYLKGDEEASDLFLAESSDEGRTFGEARRVNEEAATLWAGDGVRPCGLDLGPDGSVHVAWVSRAGDGAPAVHYRKVAPDGELGPVEHLVEMEAMGVGCDVTVDAMGNVFVFFASGETVPVGEDAEDPDPVGRLMVIRTGPEGGFGEPVSIDPRHGVSLLSGLTAHVDEVVGTVIVLYRAAKPVRKNLMRDVRLLVSSDGEEFETIAIETNKQKGDPRSGGALAQDESTTIAAWEGYGHVGWGHIRRKGTVDISKEPKGGGGVERTAPALAVTPGVVLMAWVERDPQSPDELPIVGWQAWTRVEAAMIGLGIAPESPLTSSPAIIERHSDGGFTVLY